MTVVWDACTVRVASLRLRLLAAFVDATAVVASIAVLVGGGVAGAAVYARVRGDEGDPFGEEENGQDDDEEVEPDGAEHDVPSGISFATPGSRQSPLLRGATAGLAIAGRNWRSPGFRFIGLRRVDAHTGGMVTVRSAVIGVLFDHVWEAAWRPLFRSRAQRHQTRLRALAPQLKAAERTAGEDRLARSRARTEFYQSNPVNPAGGCGWLVASALVSQSVLALSSRGGRTIRDRITGTGVIVDRRPPIPTLPL
jgi:hypothetical protein